MPTWPRGTVLAVSVAGGLALAVDVVAQTAIGWTTGDTVWNLLVVAPLFLLGAVVVWRRPGHPETRRLNLLGASVAASAAIEASAYLFYGHRPPGGAFWVLNLAYGLVGGIQVVAAALLIGLYPDGVPERRWLAVLQRSLWAYLALPVLQLLTDPVVMVSSYFPVQPYLPSPFYVPWLAPLSPAVAGLLDSALPVLVGIGMLLARYRLAERAGRMRMRWLLYVSVVGGLGFAVAAGLTVVGASGRWSAAAPGAATILAIWLLVGGITVAILRHGIFDIDVLMRRSTAYAMVWLGIAALYVAAAATPGLALGGRIPVQLAVVVTILVSLAVQPVRRRLELLADRLVFGRRASRYEVLQDFGASLERSIDSADLLPHVAAAVREGLGASWVRVSLRVPELATTYPAYAESGTVVGLPTLGQDLRHGGEVVGRIDCGSKEGGYDEADRALLDTLTGQAGTAVANVWLTAQLAERVRQLDSSRARLVSAQDEERRRIERNIHDGAQQELVAMLTKLGLARSRVARGDSPEQLLVELQSDAREVLHNLRELAQGIHPSVLSDNGLVAALRTRAGRLPVPVTLRADDGLARARLDADVEGAAYFVVCEALTNVAKHAHASTATVELAATTTCLRMRVSDDGIGFDPTGRPGTGLASMRDRADAVGGHLRVDRRPGGGTLVCAEIPLAVGAVPEPDHA